MEIDIETIREYLTTYGLRFLAAIAVFVVGRWLAKVVSKLVGKSMIRAKVDRILVTFVENLSKIILLVLVIIAALSAMGLQTASFVALIGAAGLAVGLALQGSLANFASGILMIIFKPFKVGDFVEVAGTKGTVKEVQIFNTVLDSPDNVRIFVPNAQVTGGNIMNYTTNGIRRVDLVVGISYEDDLRKARQVIAEVLTGDERVLNEPAMTVAVSELADSSVNFVVRPWVRADDYWDAYFDLTEELKLALDKNAISIPFPQRDIHVKQGAI